MEVRVNISLAEYIERGNRNADTLLASDHPLIGLLKDHYDFFGSTLWADELEVPRVPMLLSSNAFLMWTSAVRTALSGHEASVYPILRTALESACYALLITQRPELAHVWTDRNNGPDELKKSRKAFGYAIKDASDILDARETGVGDFVRELYDSSIDAGGHPNVIGIMNHVVTEPPTETEERFHQGSVYPGNSIPVTRALSASIEFAHAISIILAFCLPMLPKAVGERIRELQLNYSEILKKRER